MITSVPVLMSVVAKLKVNRPVPAPIGNTPRKSGTWIWL